MDDQQRFDSQMMQNRLKGETFPTEGEWSSSFIDTDIRDFFDELFLQTGLRRADIIRKSYIDRSYGYQLLDGSRIGKNDYYLSIAIAMELDLSTTNRLLALTKSGGLHPLIKRDAAVIFAINHAYDNDQLYHLMIELGLEPLDTGLN
ncbi:MAG: hypothetical protein LBU61_05320 [Coriobacteriales bacterium]|jgi:hypothetical protein|nr:hypothetical protein [Coriobacteriales bacterium]